MFLAMSWCRDRLKTSPAYSHDRARLDCTCFWPRHGHRAVLDCAEAHVLGQVGRQAVGAKVIDHRSDMRFAVAPYAPRESLLARRKKHWRRALLRQPPSHAIVIGMRVRQY